MASLAFFINHASLVSAACRDPEKLPAALISCGVVKAAAALGLIIYKTPGGIFLKLPYFLYDGILVFVVVFGLIEASSGFWWVSGDVMGSRAAGMTILWLGLLLIVMVAAIGGFVILNVK